MIALLEGSRSYGNEGLIIHERITPDGGKQWGVTRCITPRTSFKEQCGQLPVDCSKVIDTTRFFKFIQRLIPSILTRANNISVLRAQP